MVLFTYIWLFFMVNVGIYIYTIHGWYRILNKRNKHDLFLLEKNSVFQPTLRQDLRSAISNPSSKSIDGLREFLWTVWTGERLVPPPKKKVYDADYYIQGCIYI